jgi:hypothetical protein
MSKATARRVGEVRPTTMNSDEIAETVETVPTWTPPNIDPSEMRHAYGSSIYERDANPDNVANHLAIALDHLKKAIESSEKIPYIPSAHLLQLRCDIQKQLLQAEYTASRAQESLKCWQEGGCRPPVKRMDLREAHDRLHQERGY